MHKLYKIIYLKVRTQKKIKIEISLDYRFNKN